MNDALRRTYHVRDSDDHRRGWALWNRGPVGAVMASMFAAVVLLVALPSDPQPTAAQVPSSLGDITAKSAVLAEEPVPVTTFDEIVYSGEGNAVQEIALPDIDSGLAVITVQHTGQSNLLVWALDADQADSELLFNEIGAYQGSVLMRASTGALRIEADGAWTATISPVAQAATFAGIAEGTGSSVLLYTGGDGDARMSHAGEGAFAVWETTDADHSKLLVNGIGEFSGQASIAAGPKVLAIEADGEWTIDVPQH